MPGQIVVVQYGRTPGQAASQRRRRGCPRRHSLPYRDVRAAANPGGQALSRTSVFGRLQQRAATPILTAPQPPARRRDRRRCECRARSGDAAVQDRRQHHRPVGRQRSPAPRESGVHRQCRGAGRNRHVAEEGALPGHPHHVRLGQRARCRLDARIHFRQVRGRCADTAGADPRRAVRSRRRRRPSTSGPAVRQTPRRPRASPSRARSWKASSVPGTVDATTERVVPSAAAVGPALPPRSRCTAI